jgi:hypothetical protein
VNGTTSAAVNNVNRSFQRCSLNLEKKSAVYCYEYHKELLHNPVLTADDISGSIAEK